jgi:hypothetical protein
MKKIFFIICILLISNDIYSQEDKIVELTTSASGKTKEEAIHNSLRSTIEQAFGVFISSKTEILNDGLLTDQIISLSNGNIQQYEIISEIQIKNNSEYAVTTKSKVSISKLTSFIESKGIEVEFKGSLFAMNIKMQQLNEESEINVIKEMCAVLKNISDCSFDFSIEPETEPTLNRQNNQKWDIPLLIKVKLNSNFENYKNYFIKTLKAISLNEVEAKNYINLKKPIYTIMFRNNIDISDEVDVPLYDYIIFRNNISSILLQDLMIYFAHSMQNFIIDDGISKRNYGDLLPERTDYTNDREFAIENCCEAFYPVILEGNGYWDYDLGILFANNRIKKNLNLTLLINDPQEYNDKHRNPSDFGKYIFDKSGPLRQSCRSNINIANVTSTERRTSDPNIKLPRVPIEYFPNLKNEVNKTLILNSSFNMVIQFNKLDDVSGISAIYKFVDRRTIEDINKIKGYKIYSNK